MTWRRVPILLLISLVALACPYQESAMWWYPHCWIWHVLSLCYCANCTHIRYKSIKCFYHTISLQLASFHLQIRCTWGVLWQMLRSLYLNPFCFGLIYFLSHAVTTGACHSQWTKTLDHLLYILDLSCFCDSQLTYIPKDLFLFCLCSLGQLWCRISLSFEHCPREGGVTLVRHSKAPVGWAQISKGSKDRLVWCSTYKSTTSISCFEVIQLNEHQF
jgi:hypothetical protein